MNKSPQKFQGIELLETSKAPRELLNNLTPSRLHNLMSFLRAKSDMVRQTKLSDRKLVERKLEKKSRTNIIANFNEKRVKTDHHDLSVLKLILARGTF